MSENEDHHNEDEGGGGCFGFFMFLLAVSILSLILGTLNEVFGLGVWNDDYPGLGTDEEGSFGTVPVGFGKFVWQFALMGLAYGLIAFLIAVFRASDES